ncbi:MAG: pantetheine-phosphate adenylyltransferase, partial [Gemmatimonadales bacterium]
RADPRRAHRRLRGSCDLLRRSGDRARLLDPVLDFRPRVSFTTFNALLADFARTVNATFIVRGLRAVSDFEYEYQMALMNRQLHPTLETVFLIPPVAFTYLSSSLVREVAQFGGDVDAFVHPAVAAALKRKFAT